MTSKEKKLIESYVEKAESLQQEGRFDEAVAELRKALRASQDKAAVHRELAVLYSRQHLVDEAILALRKAIKLDPTEIQAREMLLELLMELSRFDEAISESKELLHVSQRNLSAREVLSIAYLQKGMLDKALKMTNDLITLDPSSPANHFRRAWLFQQKGDYGNAITEFSRVLEMQPDSDMARDAQQAIDSLDSFQLRHIITLALEDYIFRAKLIRDPEAASIERGYYLSLAGLAALKQVRFEDLPEVYTEWKQRYYH